MAATYVVGLMEASEWKQGKYGSLSVSVNALGAIGSSKKGGIRIQVRTGDGLVQPDEAEYDHDEEHGQFQGAEDVVETDAPSPRHAVDEAAKGIGGDGDGG